MKKQHYRFEGTILLNDTSIYEIRCRTKHLLLRALRREFRKLRAEGTQPIVLGITRV